MTLKFNTGLDVVKIHVCAKFYPAKRSGSWIVVLALDRKKQKLGGMLKTILPPIPRHWSHSVYTYVCWRKSTQSQNFWRQSADWISRSVTTVHPGLCLLTL